VNSGITHLGAVSKGRKKKKGGGFGNRVVFCSARVSQKKPGCIDREKLAEVSEWVGRKQTGHKQPRGKRPVVLNCIVDKSNESSKKKKSAGKSGEGAPTRGPRWECSGKSRSEKAYCLMEGRTRKPGNCGKRKSKKEKQVWFESKEEKTKKNKRSLDIGKETRG